MLQCLKFPATSKYSIERVLSVNNDIRQKFSTFHIEGDNSCRRGLHGVIFNAVSQRVTHFKVHRLFDNVAKSFFIFTRHKSRCKISPRLFFCFCLHLSISPAQQAPVNNILSLETCRDVDGECCNQLFDSLVAVCIFIFMLIDVLTMFLWDPKNKRKAL